MRFLVATAFYLFFMGVSAQDNSTTTVDDNCSLTNKTNPMIYWDRDNILNPAKIAKKECNCNTTTTVAPITTTTESLCPDGWINYESSCYWYSDVSNSMSEAYTDCEEKNSTLFVANTKNEWDYITSEKNKNIFNWIGLQKENSELDATWTTSDGLPIDEVPFLLKNQTNLAMNGWTDYSRCAASFNTATEAGKYVYFYNCDYKFNFICERNATIYHNYPCYNRL